MDVCMQRIFCICSGGLILCFDNLDDGIEYMSVSVCVFVCMEGA